MTTLFLMFLAAVFGCILTHFMWAAIHKAEIDGKDVLLDEVKQAKIWTENELAEFKAKLGGKTGTPTLPTPPPIPNPPAP